MEYEKIYSEALLEEESKFKRIYEGCKQDQKLMEFKGIYDACKLTEDETPDLFVDTTSIALTEPVITSK